MRNYQNHVLELANSALPWDKLEGRNVLVTGATGLLGFCVIDVLMSQQRARLNVFGLARNESLARSRFRKYEKCENFHFICHDITEPLKSNLDFHYIIHAASYGNPKAFADNPVEVMKANLLGVMNLLDYGRSHYLERFLFVSSGEIYGEGNGNIFEESYSGYVDSMAPRSCYPSSKRAAETLCASYAKEYGFDVVIVRPCHIYGPTFTSSDNRVYAQFLRNVLNGEDIIMKSTGDQFRSWCYLVDCVSGLLYVLLLGAQSEAYNIADPNSTLTIRDMAEMIAHIGGCNVVINVPSEAERKSYNPVHQSVFSVSKLQALGWSITGTMEAKMRMVIEDLIDSKGTYDTI